MLSALRDHKGYPYVNQVQISKLYEGGLKCKCDIMTFTVFGQTLVLNNVVNLLHFWSGLGRKLKMAPRFQQKKNSQ